MVAVLNLREYSYEGLYIGATESQVLCGYTRRSEIPVILEAIVLECH